MNKTLFLKFAFVGSFGFITNLFCFYIFSNYFLLNVNVSSIIAFILANAQNYIFNSSWTFHKSQHRVSFMKYIQYLSSSTIGLAVNLITLNLSIYFLGINYKFAGQILGVAGGSLFNYKFSKYFVFEYKK